AYIHVVPYIRADGSRHPFVDRGAEHSDSPRFPLPLHPCEARWRARHFSPHL
ncbi:hypothetical protein TGRUB_224800B, partial [Toxoplasma gondii RUB]